MALADALESRLGEHLEFSRPQGGMFLWARFRYPFDTMEWMKKTLENDAGLRAAEKRRTAETLQGGRQPLNGRQQSGF